ncbi:hypothetical protein BDV59DRAFT_175209 [Aspergillus ambiguus]|uniref:uncharacterized protein n=1 Tax=Aspergillus ambiguus TaxID=176160 RepID=UPI003CCCBA3F
MINESNDSETPSVSKDSPLLSVSSGLAAKSRGLVVQLDSGTYHLSLVNYLHSVQIILLVISPHGICGALHGTTLTRDEQSLRNQEIPAHYVSNRLKRKIWLVILFWETIAGLFWAFQTESLCN